MMKFKELLIVMALGAVSCTQEYQYFGDSVAKGKLNFTTSIDSIYKDKNNNAVVFYLGKFKDIGGFSDFAQGALRGSIEFYISPTKDASNVAYIEISPVFSSGLAVTEWNDEAKEWGVVGPCIYDKGRQWYNPWGSGLITSDWSPASTMHNVRLTPKANIELAKLFSMLKKGKINRIKNGYAYENGVMLSKQEVKDAVKYGILVPID